VVAVSFFSKSGNKDFQTNFEIVFMRVIETADYMFHLNK
jgi:hypothetical protein